jgi:hypothetical protein
VAGSVACPCLQEWNIIVIMHIPNMLKEIRLDNISTVYFYTLLSFVQTMDLTELTLPRSSAENIRFSLPQRQICFKDAEDKLFKYCRLKCKEDEIFLKFVHNLVPNIVP